MGFLKSISSPFVDAANAVAGATVDASNTIVDGAKAAANGIADTTISAVEEAEGVAQVVGGAMIDAADVVGTTVATFGSEVECFSVAAGGTIVDWTETAAHEVADLSQSVASNIRTFSPVLYGGLKIALAESVNALKALANLFGDELPSLQPPDSTAKLVAQMIFSFVFTEAMEAACRRNGTTIGWGVEFSGGIGLGGTVLVGLYCDSGGEWGFYEGTAGLPTEVEAEFTNGLTVTVNSIVVFGSRDDFSGARVIDPGVELQVGPYVAGAKILLKRSNLRFLGFTTVFGAGVSPKKKTNAAAVDAAKQSPAAKKAHLAEYAFTFPALKPGGVLELLDDAAGVTDQGASVELAVDAAHDPENADRLERLANAASFPPFAPSFIGTISAPQYPERRLAYSGSFDLALALPGETTVRFRLRASAADPNLVVLVALSGDQGGIVWAPSHGKAGHGPLPTENGAVFRMVKGLRDGGGGVSFESIDHPGTYLRYYYFGLVGHPYNDHPTFREEATFLLVPEPYEAVEGPAIRLGEVITPSFAPVRISADCRTALWLKADGRLRTDVWSSPTPPPGDGEITLQMADDGRLGVYRGDARVWASDVHGDPGPCFAAITNESHLAVFRGTPEDPGAMVWSSKSGAIHWWTARQTVAIKGPSGRFFAPDDAKILRSNATGLGARELFTMFTLYDGRVALLASNGDYVCAEYGGGAEVVANRPAIGPWECFTLIETGDGYVSLQASNGDYVCAEHGGGVEVVANRNAIGPWERFVLVDVDASCGWESLGGVLQSTPAVSHRGNGVDQPGEGEVEILARGPKSALLSRRHTPDGGWAPWTTIYTDAQSSPAICQSASTTMRGLVGYDRSCWLNAGEHGQLGQSWEWHGGLWIYGPAITSWGPGRFDIWTVGDDRNLQQRAFSNGVWEPWYNHGGILTSAPSGASMHHGHHTICARGTDKAIWYRTFAGSWTGWTSLGGVLTSAPSLVARASDAMDLFARGSDMALYRKRYVAGAWTGWERLGGNLGSAPAAVVMHDRVDVYARSADGGLMRLKVDVSWYHHGDGFSALVGGGDHLYAIQSSTGDIVRVNGGSGSVTKIGDPGHQFVAGRGWIAGITTDQSAIYRWDGATWTQIGGPATALLGGRDELYAIAPSGDLMRYDGGDQWTKISDPADRFVVGDGFVAQITADKSAVRRWNGGLWTTIGGAMADLVTAERELYAIDALGDIHRYGGEAGVWIKAGGPGHVFAGGSDLLTGITPDRTAVAYRRRRLPWTIPSGGPSGGKALTVIGSRIYVLTDAGALYGYEL